MTITAAPYKLLFYFFVISKSQKRKIMQKNTSFESKRSVLADFFQSAVARARNEGVGLEGAHALAQSHVHT